MVKFLKRSSSHELVIIHEFSHAYTPKKVQKTTYCPKGQSIVAPTARVFIYAYFCGRDSRELVVIHEFSHAYTPKKVQKTTYCPKVQSFVAPTVRVFILPTFAVATRANS